MAMEYLKRWSFYVIRFGLIVCVGKVGQANSWENG
jgi:hypothetical protein